MTTLQATVTTRRYVVLAICCASLLISVMDISIVNMALPAIRDDLKASTAQLQWTVDAYTLVLASFLMLAGSTADRYGRKRMFRLGLTVFGLGSLLCSLAPGIDALIAARAVQAVGGTMLNPVAMAIVVTVFPDRAERARAIGIFGATAGLSLVLGPILGGALVDGLGWRSIFWVNLPIVVVAVLLAGRYVPESRAAHGRRFDPVGQVLVVLLLGGVVTAIIESEKRGWTAPPVLALLLVAAIAAVVLIPYERRRVEPMLELRLFRSVPFSSAVVIALFAYSGFGVFLFVTTLYLQSVRHLSALNAGLSLLPVGLLICVLSPLTGRVVGARGPRLPLVVAGTALTLGAAASLTIGLTTPLPVVLAIFLLFGVFLGVVNPPIANSAVSGMPVSMAGLAGSLASVGRQTGTSLGVAAAGSIVGATATTDPRGFVRAAHVVWWPMIAVGLVVVALALIGTSRRARLTVQEL
ncbi:EmrB/QacA subfamily drug resistance transporter [Kribbella aluminosa]|uniref:EmrB/QacA subfamily drug resistance transporter n=1 Tax=Kribbella aluminosa TaxID=416017 RepID=A0ABS4UHG2_9ACTN|nr:MFS transporter [Kribbella aluminosa]MBP2351070.1 EmrB/QacA subfamily drug resistance transporter [Kribbella aluminosa]